MGNPIVIEDDPVEDVVTLVGQEEQKTYREKSIEQKMNVAFILSVVFGVKDYKLFFEVWIILMFLWTGAWDLDVKEKSKQTEMTEESEESEKTE